ncbi:hypothetical protein GCM10011335_42150 [Aureimonas glaciei]|uniref:Uncharacterized protein n=1 Tax=Aureimonas glaciei TaxID=1776957 RepID=A0A917DEY5_9HYPH|nr:hypothetical protein GCM10011335_42150 [Aureimonas glaciei]
MIVLTLFSLIVRYWIVAIAAGAILAVFAISPRSEETGIYVMLVVSMAALTLATWQQRSMVRALASVENQVSGLHTEVDRFLDAMEKRTRVLDSTQIEIARV